LTILERHVDIALMRYVIQWQIGHNRPVVRSDEGKNIWYRCVNYSMALYRRLANVPPRCVYASHNPASVRTVAIMPNTSANFVLRSILLPSHPLSS
jgi:hypothetical protein